MLKHLLMGNLENINKKSVYFPEYSRRTIGMIYAYLQFSQDESCKNCGINLKQNRET